MAVNQNDLVGSRLKVLLEEIEGLASDGTKESYEKLEKLMTEVYRISSNSTVTADGKKIVSVRENDVDITETLKNIIDITNNGIDKNTANMEEQKARQALRKRISSTIGVLLREDEIMQELSGRDLNNDDFVKRVEAEIKKSEEKVASLESLQKKPESVMDKFGKTVYLETQGKYVQKSKLDKLRIDEDSIGIMEKMQSKLAEMQKLKQATEIMAKDSRDYANNIVKIESLLLEVKDFGNELKTLDLHDSKENKLDFSYVEELNVKSDFKTADAKLEAVKIAIDLEVKKDYEAIKDIVKSDFEKFGFKKVEDVDSLSKPEVLAKINEIAKQPLKGVTKQLSKEVDPIAEEIKYEERYQHELKNSLEKFKGYVEKDQTLSAKFDENNLPTEEARKEYLDKLGIDEFSYTKEKEAVALKETEERAENLTSAEKRRLIREAYSQDGGRHPIKRLLSRFFPNIMWRSYKDAYLVAAQEKAVEDAQKLAEVELNKKMKPSVVKDRVERNETKETLENIRKLYRTEIASAVSQEKMTDELFRGAKEEYIKENAVNASAVNTIRKIDDAEMLLAMNKKRRGEISKEEYESIKVAYDAEQDKKLNIDDKTVHDRAYASDVSSQTSSRKQETPNYRDER